jgi:hypothetical protein
VCSSDLTGRPLYAPIWSPLYELNGNSIYPNSPYVQTTLYEPYNDFTRGWWDNIVEEFMYAGINNTLILTRAATAEGRQWDTLKTNLIPALKRAGIYDFMKFGQFEDCGAWQGAFQALTGQGAINWADTTTMIRIMWDECIKRFYDFMPPELVLHFNGRPLWVGWWSGGNNLQGNVSKVLREVKKRFKTTYKEDLFIVIDNSWRKGDNTITALEADAVQNWFCCGQAGSLFTWNNCIVGVGVPGFGVFNSDGTPAAHGATFDRSHGVRLKQILDSSVSAKANIMIEEGYVDLRESAGIYRSPKWDYPSQYLEIVREFLDSKTETRRFQAEACDSFYNKTSTNTSVIFSSRKLDIGTLPAPNYGWYVGSIDAGDWLLWRDAFFANGSYDVYFRYSASSSDNRIVFSMAGKNDTISLPSTDGVFKGKKISSRTLASGNRDLKLTFLTPGMNLDFLQVSNRSLTAALDGSRKTPSLKSGVSVMETGSGARIRYTVPYDEAILTMEIYEATGRMIWTSRNNHFGKGIQWVMWKNGTAARGVYFVKMIAVNAADNSRMVTMDKFLARGE